MTEAERYRDAADKPKVEAEIIKNVRARQRAIGCTCRPDVTLDFERFFPLTRSKVDHSPECPLSDAGTTPRG